MLSGGMVIWAVIGGCCQLGGHLMWGEGGVSGVWALVCWQRVWSVGAVSVVSRVWSLVVGNGYGQLCMVSGLWSLGCG